MLSSHGLVAAKNKMKRKVSARLASLSKLISQNKVLCSLSRFLLSSLLPSHTPLRLRSAAPLTLMHPRQLPSHVQPLPAGSSPSVLVRWQMLQLSFPLFHGQRFNLFQLNPFIYILFASVGSQSEDLTLDKYSLD